MIGWGHCPASSVSDVLSLKCQRCPDLMPGSTTDRRGAAGKPLEPAGWKACPTVGQTFLSASSRRFPAPASIVCTGHGLSGTFEMRPSATLHTHHDWHLDCGGKSDATPL